MKTRIIYLLALISVLTLFTACDSDDANDNTSKQLSGIYCGNKLNLTYSNKVMQGGVVSYNSDETNSSLILYNLVPGEPTVTISNFSPATNGSFSGQITTNEGTELKYSGNINASSHIMTLDVNVNMSSSLQGGIAGTWPLSHRFTYDAGNSKYTDVPVYFVWTAIDQNKKNGQLIASYGTTLGSHAMAEVLNEITFTSDGNVSVKYYPGIVSGNGPDGEKHDFQSWVMTKLLSNKISLLDREWQTSPANMLHWYAKEGQIYLVPNLVAIIKSSVQGGKYDIDEDGIIEMINGISEMDDAMLKNVLAVISREYGKDFTNFSIPLLHKLMQWTETGIPLKYTNDGNQLMLYIDKDNAEILMEVLIYFLPSIQSYIEKSNIDESTMSLIMMFLGINSLSDIETIWKENTDQFAFGIRFFK